jgi:hypothetical protein
MAYAAPGIHNINHRSGHHEYLMRLRAALTLRLRFAEDRFTLERWTLERASTWSWRARLLAKLMLLRSLSAAEV